MLPYSRQLKQNSRELRSNMTDAEQKLWYRLRRKQINGWQFYRQKIIGSYIVDFYCPAARLVVELDGSQHFEPQHQAADQKRDAYLVSLGCVCCVSRIGRRCWRWMRCWGLLHKFLTLPRKSP